VRREGGGGSKTTIGKRVMEKTEVGERVVIGKE